MIPSPSPSVKIQIMGRKVYLRCKGKTLLGDVNKLFVFKSLLTTPPTPQANFPAHNLNFHRRWRWWDQIQAIFLNLLYLKNKRHICDICGKSYNYQKSLKYHYDSVHEGIKPQPQQCVCEQCGKVFCNNQRFVQSIGEIKKALWFFCLVLLQVPKCFVTVQIFWASPKIWLHLKVS